MKRLYVRPEGRGQGVASKLVAAALDAAREIGYREVLLSTIPSMMGSALRLYEAMGFEETGPFKDHSAVADGAELLHLRFHLLGGV
jgi:ribosomal protein S18 acetylase RimI-like enzyme